MVKPTSQFSARSARSPRTDASAGAVPLSRRALLRWAALAGGTLGAAELLAACGADPGGAAGGPGQRAPSGSLRALAENLPQLSILNAQTELPVEHSRFAFGLSAENNRLVEGVSPRVWLARDQTGRALGPFQARWLELGAYDKTHDRSPRSDLKGFYVAEVDLPEQPGQWLAVAIVEEASQRTAGQGSVQVAKKVQAPVSSKAIPGPSPVATSPSAIARICTRNPVCPLHYVSLDHALRSGRPTVLSFATPLLCTSRMCGPVIDELMLAYQKVGKQRANFIHLEIYPERDTAKPAQLYVDWGLKSEPWTVVIDPDGLIRSRSEGPMVASEIQTALRPLL